MLLVSAFSVSFFNAVLAASTAAYFRFAFASCKLLSNSLNVLKAASSAGAFAASYASANTFQLSLV